MATRFSVELVQEVLANHGANDLLLKKSTVLRRRQLILPITDVIKPFCNITIAGIVLEKKL